MVSLQSKLPRTHYVPETGFLILLFTAQVLSSHVCHQTRCTRMQMEPRASHTVCTPPLSSAASLLCVPYDPANQQAAEPILMNVLFLVPESCLVASLLDFWLLRTVAGPSSNPQASQSSG